MDRIIKKMKYISIIFVLFILAGCSNTGFIKPINVNLELVDLTTKKLSARTKFTNISDENQKLYHGETGVNGEGLLINVFEIRNIQTGKLVFFKELQGQVFSYSSKISEFYTIEPKQSVFGFINLFEYFDLIPGKYSIRFQAFGETFSGSEKSVLMESNLEYFTVE